MQTRQPYGEWLNSQLVNLSDLKIPNQKVPQYSREECQRLQKAFGYSYEEVKTSILNMAMNGSEGNPADGYRCTACRSFLKSISLCSDYFKQLFAQVTNPPIDCDP
ncbi:MAG: glutamate synthase central domain-containing protein [Dorea sp.]